MNHYLIVFDRSESRILRIDECASSSEAMRARFRAEELHRGHPEIEIVEHLSGRVDSVPAFHGAVEWNGHGVALLQEYVPHGRDGWTWCSEAAMAGDVADIGRIGEMNEVWDAWVPAGHTPPRATVQAALANPGYLIEIVVTAAQR